MSLLDRFTRQMRFLHLGPGRAVVAVSGGPDSVALLDLLWRSREAHGLELLVGHVDHGIHSESALVARQVEALARAYELPVFVGTLRLGRDASETRARTARYDWLQELRRREGARWIVTAHHADDQVETVLLRVLGGSGPAGLAGMSPVSGVVVRPLLVFRRATLRRYLSQHGLTGWHDPANVDPAHLRSWIRAHLLPLLQSRMPDYHMRLRRLARLAALQRTAWDQVLEALPGLDPETTRGTASLSRTGLLALPRQLQVSLLSALARRVGCVLGPRRAARALAALRGAESGAVADLGSGWRLERSFDRLRVLPEVKAPEPAPVTLEGAVGETEWGSWRVSWQTEPAPADQPRDGLTAWFIPDRLRVRPWRAGDRLRPMKGRGRRLAVRCFQEKRVPRSERPFWPLVDGEEELLWIPGVCRSDGRLPRPGEPAVRVDVARR